MWKWISRTLSPRPKEPDRAGPLNGKITIDGAKLLVTNPEPGGRFPILVPSPSVVVRLGGNVLESPSPVSESDALEWELAPVEEQPFFVISLSDDAMEAKVEIISDPHWQADGAVIQDLGEGHVTLLPGVTRRSHRRPHPPLDVIRAGLAAAGVNFGVDEDALTQAVEKAEGGWRGSVVAARGQAGQAPVADRWDWAYPQGLAAPGQVVARFHLGSPNLPVVTVTGQKREIYPNEPSPEVTLGPGLRLLTSGEVVATRRGLTRVVEKKEGILWADVLDTQVLDHPAPGTTLDVDGDLAITGDVTKMKIQARGAVLITGTATESEITANSIEILGRAETCKLHTIPAANAGPLTGFLRLFKQQIAELAAEPSDYIGSFRKAQATLRYASDLIRSLPPFEPALKELMVSITRVLMAGPEGSPPPRMSALAAELERFCAEREASAADGGGVTLGSGAAACEIWSAGTIRIEGSSLHASQLFGMADIIAGEETILGQSSLLAARRVVVMGATAKRRPVTIRAGGRVTIAEAGEDTVVEIGAKSHLFRRETLRVTLGLTSRYEIKLRLD